MEQPTSIKSDHPPTFHFHSHTPTSNESPDKTHFSTNTDKLLKRLIQEVEQDQKAQRLKRKPKKFTSFQSQGQNNKTINNNPGVQKKSKKRRRSRNDPIGRDYLCGCGKTYFSYPALFLHTKQKHGGYEMEGTIRSTAGTNQKRGRPRKIPIQGAEAGVANAVGENQEERVGIKSQLRAKKDLQQLGCELAENLKLKISAPLLENIFPLNINGMRLWRDYFDIFFGKSTPERDLSFPIFLRHIPILKLAGFKQPTDQLSIDQAISLFLHNISPHCNSAFLTYLQNILISFRTCINLHHSTEITPRVPLNNLIFTLKLPGKSERKIERESESSNDVELEYSETYTCQYIPLIVEYFLEKYAVEELVEYDSDLVLAAVWDFCEWVGQWKRGCFEKEEGEDEGEERKVAMEEERENFE